MFAIFAMLVFFYFVIQYHIEIPNGTYGVLVKSFLHGFAVYYLIGMWWILFLAAFLYWAYCYAAYRGVVSENPILCDMWNISMRVIFVILGIMFL